ncbi:MAG: DUF1573 domain-containing protein [Bacteroidota bacterium]
MRQFTHLFCKFFLIVILSFSIASCTDYKVNDKHSNVYRGTSAIVFDSMDHNFGTIVEGAKISHVFKFKNIGSGLLIISSVKTSCGCTISKFKKKPVPPGGEGSLEVIYNSSDASGYQLKTVEVISNAFRKVLVLKISAEVVSK